MLTYNLDIEPGSLWLRSTPGEFASKQPYYCSEAGIFYARQDFNTSRTFKDNYILFYTFEGTGLIHQSDRTVELPANHALLMNCRYPQAYKTKGDTWKHYWIHIDGAGIASLENLLIPNGRLQPIPVPDSARYHFDAILRNLETETTEAILSDSLEIHQILTMLTQSILQNSSREIGTVALIRESADYIRLHYRQEIAIEDLLEITHLSKSYYLDMFRQYIGTTPHNYLLSSRITKAKEMLETTDKSITQIADETGFRDVSAFSVRFSKMTGQSPSQYRKNALLQQS